MSLTIEDTEEFKKTKAIIVVGAGEYINLREYLTEEIKSGMIIIAKTNGYTLDEVVDIYEKAVNKDRLIPTLKEVVAIKSEEVPIFDRPKNHHKHHNRHFGGHGNKKKKRKT